MYLELEARLGNLREFSQLAKVAEHNWGGKKIRAKVLKHQHIHCCEPVLGERKCPPDTDNEEKLRK